MTHEQLFADILSNSSQSKVLYVDISKIVMGYAAATEEQTAAMNQMTSSAQSLTELADNLSKMVSIFNVNT
jgi:methyl-accepting chemotaxis protein